MPDFDSHIRRGHPIFFGLLMFFSFIEGCDTAWLVSQYNMHGGFPDQSYRDRLSFLVFTSWWTFLFCGLYIAAFFVSSLNFVASIASHGIWIFLTWVFWLSGAAAWTAALGGGLICSRTDVAYCNQLVAAEAFAWICFILISVMFILIAVMGSAALRRGDRLSSGLLP